MNRGHGRRYRRILDRVADKWSLLVIALLEEQTFRFGELRREIDGISTRMPTVTLRNLERDGLIDRRMYPKSLRVSSTDCRNWAERCWAPSKLSSNGPNRTTSNSPSP